MSLNEMLIVKEDFDDDDEEDDYDEKSDHMIYEGWNEDDDSNFIQCIFCPAQLNNPNLVFEHCHNDHNFNFSAFKEKHFFDCYLYIKFINFVRAKSPSVSQLLNYTQNEEPWRDDLYLTPQKANDLLLCFDIESEITCASSNLTGKKEAHHDLNDSFKISDDKQPSNDFTNSDYQDILLRLKNEQNLNLELKNKLELAYCDIELIKKKMIEILNVEINNETVLMNQKEISNLDCTYFDSYAHYSIHEEMIKDKVRTETYMNCILGNREMFQDAVVLDVGCGTGILSLFAAQAGAKLVIGVDMSDIVYNAMDIVIKNGFEKKIIILKGKIEDICLPVAKVDIIISEWMGYCLLFESMLDSILLARDKYLSTNGALLPTLASIRLVGISDMEVTATRINFWDDVYGFDMSSMKTLICDEAEVKYVNNERIATDHVSLKSFDLATCQTSDLDFTTAFQLSPMVDAALTSVVLYFDIHFQCPKPYFFSTSPNEEKTHWKQTILHLKEPIKMQIGKQVTGKISIQKNVTDHRALKITLTLEDKIYKYNMQ